MYKITSDPVTCKEETVSILETGYGIANATFKILRNGETFYVLYSSMFAINA